MPGGLILADSEAGIFDVLIWSGALVVCLFVLFGVVMLYRRWMNSEEATSDEGFTLSDLRRLHKEGKMTNVEFESAKAVLIGSIKAKASKASEGPINRGSGFDVLPPEQ